jgi:hypothetical protein
MSLKLWAFSHFSNSGSSKKNSNESSSNNVSHVSSNEVVELGTSVSKNSVQRTMQKVNRSSDDSGPRGCEHQQVGNPAVDGAHNQQTKHLMHHHHHAHGQAQQAGAGQHRAEGLTGSPAVASSLAVPKNQPPGSCCDIN